MSLASWWSYDEEPERRRKDWESFAKRQSPTSELGQDTAPASLDRFEYIIEIAQNFKNKR